LGAARCSRRQSIPQQQLSRKGFQMTVVIRVRPNGPLLIDGPVTVVDQHGNAFPLNPDKPSVALCRCGQSAKRPFCDGTHNRCGFQSVEIAPVAPE
jgi:CDGSH-type Zn-finger protein